MSETLVRTSDPDSPAAADEAHPQFRSFDRPALPPLRVVHILAYVTVCCAYLAFVSLPQINKRLRASISEQEHPIWTRIDEVAKGLCNSVFVTVGLLLAVWRMHGMRVLDQPGHSIAVWKIWGLISTFCILKLIDLAQWVAGVHNADDYIRMWGWLKGFYVLGSGPFVLLFLLLAIGWRNVATTWAWKAYFSGLAMLLVYPVIESLPYDWRQIEPMWYSNAVFRFYWVPLVILVVALLTDLLPGRPRRHWSHWVAAFQPIFLGGIALAMSGRLVVPWW